MADQAKEAVEAQIPESKGKAPDTYEDVSIDEDEDEDDEEGDGDESDVEHEDLGEDGQGAIDPDNIVPNGRRTRGKIIDFKKAAEKEDLPAEDDEEDDDDYKAPDDEMEE